jgi:hypothetical protein
MGLHIRRIISGGQTGADQGGLVAARELGIDTGGIAPQGWLTENGPQRELLQGFGLTECAEEGYPARTRQNIAIADGTVLIGPYESGGSKLTHETAVQLGKPLLLITSPPDTDNIDNKQHITEFRQWLHDHKIQTLNVAGNRESQRPGIGEFTRDFLLRALQEDCRRAL